MRYYFDENHWRTLAYSSSVDERSSREVQKKKKGKKVKSVQRVTRRLEGVKVPPMP